MIIPSRQYEKEAPSGVIQKAEEFVGKINEPIVCSTEVFLLAESILPLVKEKLLRRLHALEA